MSPSSRGAAGTLGRTIVHHLAARGASVVLVDKDAQRLEQAHHALASYDDRISPFATDLNDPDTPEDAAWNLQGQPIAGVCTPQDVAEAACFLASKRARFITGIDLVIDGGATLVPAAAVLRPSLRSYWRKGRLILEKEAD